MKKFLSIFFILLFSFCSKKESQYPQLLVDDVEDVVEVNTNQMLQSISPILALNFVGDTSLIKNIYRVPGNQFIDLDDNIPSNHFLKVFIDTSYQFYNKGYVFRNVKYPSQVNHDSILKYKYDEMKIPEIRNYFTEMDSLKKTYVSSYPVLVFNKSSTMQHLSQLNSDRGLVMIQEALDLDKKWKPIEFIFEINDCGTGRSDLKIYPRHYIAAGTIKYNGDFKTKIRIKLMSQNKIYYSNEIKGSINRSQFDQDFIPDFLNQRGRYYKDYLNEDKKWMFLKLEANPKG